MAVVQNREIIYGLFEERWLLFASKYFLFPLYI